MYQTGKNWHCSNPPKTSIYQPDPGLPKPDNNLPWPNNENIYTPTTTIGVSPDYVPPSTTLVNPPEFTTNVRVIGRCSLCGGRVVVPSIIFQVGPVTPQCEKCGATYHVEDTLPILPMRPGRKYLQEKNFTFSRDI